MVARGAGPGLRGGTRAARSASETSTAVARRPSAAVSAARAGCRVVGAAPLAAMGARGAGP
eukprot:2691982-Alexandrium_andersonii.AAC.1